MSSKRKKIMTEESSTDQKKKNTPHSLNNHSPYTSYVQRYKNNIGSEDRIDSGALKREREYIMKHP